MIILLHMMCEYISVTLSEILTINVYKMKQCLYIPPTVILAPIWKARPKYSSYKF